MKALSNIDKASPSTDTNLTTPKMQQYTVETETWTKRKTTVSAHMPLAIFEDNAKETRCKENLAGKKEPLDPYNESASSKEKQAGENEPLLSREEDPFKEFFIVKKQEAGEMMQVPLHFIDRLDIFLNYVIHYRASNNLVKWIEHEKAWHVLINDIRKTKSFLRMFSSYDTFQKALERHGWKYMYNKEEKDKDYQGYEHVVNKAVKLVRRKDKPKEKKQPSKLIDFF
jgi:hypothetical protein